MNIYDLNNIINGKIININKKEYSNIQTDTRKVDHNSLLFIFKFEHDNAYKYIKNMKKIPAIIVINDDEENIFNMSCIKVKNTIIAYSLLASYYKNKNYIPTIMITGSVGKTTTKDLIYDILSMSYKCKKTIDSKNNIVFTENKEVVIDKLNGIYIIESKDKIYIGKKSNISNLKRYRYNMV